MNKSNLLPGWVANSVDLDQMLYYAMSDVGLHYA